MKDGDPARATGVNVQDCLDMTIPTSRALLRLSTLGAALVASALLTACVVEPPAPRYVQAPPRPAPGYATPAPQYAPDNDPVVSVYVDPPIDQPEPIAVQWAPPPMLVEVPPPQPYPDAVWTGGYWAWEGRWFWAAGRWAPPPRPSYFWVQPYYEHRADVVIFVPGFWCAPERHFMPPPPGLSISIALAAPGVRFGHPPMGPQGVFVPPPPGSRAGIIVPAPIGTPPAVVMSAPAVVNVGMRIRGNLEVNSRNTTNNVTNITNVTNVTIEAPAGATANGQAFQNSVPARAQLAAALAPAGRPVAPQPVSQQAIPSYQSGRAPMQLPAAQALRNDRNPPMPARPAPAAPAPQPQPQAPQAQAGPAPGRPGQQRPQEFDPPPRQPAQINGQPAPPTGQPQRPPAPGQQPGQPQAQAQSAGQQAAQPQTAPQDQRRRGGNPPAQPGAQPGQRGQAGAQPGQPGAQPAAAPGQSGAVKPKDGKEAAREKDARKRTEQERKDDREKKDGERDR